MGGLQTGGGTSAVAASAHAGCVRFRLTDSFVTGESRRALAARLGEPDVGAGIPQARWVRAMMFEKLVRDDRFVAELLTTTLGQLGLPRPAAVRRRDCRGDVGLTAVELADAHRQAMVAGEATMLVALGVPYLELEHVPEATSILPDFAIVCPRSADGPAGGSWLIMGDAKDYERVRSRIDDGRMLKGFLQVALGAESAAAWTRLPDGMRVHDYGTLAVPRNAFLRPQAVVELLTDHRAEVRARAQERLAARSALGEDTSTAEELAAYVAHLEATFDPRSCTSCNLFSYCRTELRSSADPLALLIEIGVAPAVRTAVQPLITGLGEAGRAPHATVAQITATVTGMPQWNRRPRVDPCGRAGTVNLVLVKSDASALGVHGVAVQPVGAHGPAAWTRRSFADPQAADTRRAVMGLIGRAIQELHEAGLEPVHLVVADRPTVDLLASAADSLAGVELSRLRWQRDQDCGRPLRTFDDEEATLPVPLTADERLAVSFLLEEDRARTMRLRTPIVDLHGVLIKHVIPGGPTPDAGRIDYLVAWAEAIAPLDHRKVSDVIAEQSETPGARLSNRASDALHHALGKDRAGYDRLVLAALDYRIGVTERALAILDGLPVSQLREVHQTLESDAQQVWRRRLALQASDLVRFSRMYPHWRNTQVELLDDDRSCSDQLTCLTDLSAAHDKAADAGVRQLALATVIGVDPIRLDVQSRRMGEGAHVVALHVNDRSLAEENTTTLTIQKGAFKLGRLPAGVLTCIPDTRGFVWAPAVETALTVGDELVLADITWFGKTFKSGHEIAVARPSLDKQSAPKTDCTPTSYVTDPEAHRWCCKPHAVAEAEWSDELARRRERGELNPMVWPPLIDDEHFDVGPGGEVPEQESAPIPDGLTRDDLD